MDFRLRQLGSGIRGETRARVKLTIAFVLLLRREGKQKKKKKKKKKKKGKDIIEASWQREEKSDEMMLS
jgi:hypothetical protein